jgi:hypothetical protein
VVKVRLYNQTLLEQELSKKASHYMYSSATNTKMMGTNTNRKALILVDVLNSKAFKSIINIININSGDLVTSYFIKKIKNFAKSGEFASG